MNDAPEMTRAERDVLLLSSGELSSWRALTLRWRLRRDPAARRLAETLALCDLTLAPRPSLARPDRRPLLVAAVGVAAVLLIVLRLQPASGRAPERVSLLEAQAKETPPSTLDSLRTLRRDLGSSPLQRGSFESPNRKHSTRTGSVLLPRSSVLDLRRPRFQDQ